MIFNITLLKQVAWQLITDNWTHIEYDLTIVDISMLHTIMNLIFIIQMCIISV